MPQGHPIRRRTWTQRAILAGAIALYLAGYPAVRSEHLLVHTKSFVGSMDPEGPVVADHGIAAGDFGAPMLGLGTMFATLVAGLIDWPITKVEVLYWHIVEPSGSPYDGPVGTPPPPESFPPAPPPDLPPAATPP